jgi:hypothetical protein
MSHSDKKLAARIRMSMGRQQNDHRTVRHFRGHPAANPWVEKEMLYLKHD